MQRNGNQIVKGTRAITADTDLRLCKFFGLSEGYFLRLQSAHETMEAKRKFKKEINKIISYNFDKSLCRNRSLES